MGIKMKPFLALLLLVIAGCSTAFPKEYEPREGDLLFQSLPHSPLADAIEGVSQSPYSHCGIVAFKANQWIVIEAIGPVIETPLKDWVDRGREKDFAAYRLEASFTDHIPAILEKARTYLGRPYDIHYSFDDERIYCSELIQKSIKGVTKRVIGKNQRLGDLNWKPHKDFIRAIEGHVPLDREMITPQSLADAAELSKVFDTKPLPKKG